MVLPPLTLDEVLAYLTQVLPDIAQPAVAAALHEASGGLRVAIERTLLQWAKTGILTREDGHWVYHQPPGRPLSPANRPAAPAGEPTPRRRLAWKHFLFAAGTILLLVIGGFLLRALVPAHPNAASPSRVIASKINWSDGAEMVFIPDGVLSPGGRQR